MGVKLNTGKPLHALGVYVPVACSVAAWVAVSKLLLSFIYAFKKKKKSLGYF